MRSAGRGEKLEMSVVNKLSLAGMKIKLKILLEISNEARERESLMGSFKGRKAEGSYAHIPDEQSMIDQEYVEDKWIGTESNDAVNGKSLSSIADGKKLELAGVKRKPHRFAKTMPPAKGQASTSSQMSKCGKYLPSPKKKTQTKGTKTMPLASKQEKPSSLYR